MDKTVKEEFFADIKNSPQLPERFYEIYYVMYPESLSSGFFKHFLFHRVDSENGKSCVCSEAVYTGAYPLYVKTTEIIPIINMVESNFSQKECLDYYINTEIKRNKIDIGNLSSLSDEGIVRLLLQIENPSYYNEKHYPDRVQEKVDIILNNLN